MTLDFTILLSDLSISCCTNTCLLLGFLYVWFQTLMFRLADRCSPLHFRYSPNFGCETEMGQLKTRLVLALGHVTSENAVRASCCPVDLIVVST